MYTPFIFEDRFHFPVLVWWSPSRSDFSHIRNYSPDVGKDPAIHHVTPGLCLLICILKCDLFYYKLFSFIL